MKMQKVTRYGQCPLCGDFYGTEYIGGTDFICCACRVVWAQAARHPNYTYTRHPYQPDWYYVYGVEASEESLGQFDPCPSDS